jgi:hypothetical protein
LRDETDEYEGESYHRTDISKITSKQNKTKTKPLTQLSNCKIKKKNVPLATSV